MTGPVSTITAPAGPGTAGGARIDDTVSAFVYWEAFLIDERRYGEWLALFAEDGRYWVPAGHEFVDPASEVSIIFEGRAGLSGRVARLGHERCYMQEPPPRLRHAVSNVFVLGDGDEVTVHSTQTIFEARRGRTTSMPAHTVHHLRRTDPGWEIVEKKVCLLGLDQFLPNITLL